MIEESDLNAPTCNDCHGNHGALASDVETGTHACGICRVKVAQLFSETMMMHRIEKAVEQPGRATCHGGPSDQDAAIQQHTNRRIWLALSLVPIFFVVGVLLLYIRTLPTPTRLSTSSGH